MENIRKTVDLINGITRVEELIRIRQCVCKTVVGKVEKNGFMVNGIIHEAHYHTVGKWFVREVRPSTDKEMQDRKDELLGMLDDMQLS